MISREDKNNSNLKYKFSKKELYDLYWNKELSQIKIAKVFKCNIDTIKDRMFRFNIPKRTRFEVNRLSKKSGKDHWHYKEGRHKKHYCKEPNCNNEICYQTCKNGNGRCNSCANKGIRNYFYGLSLKRENNGNWQGGNIEYGAEFDSALKEKVRFRDNYKCQICGCSQLENGKQLDCHHIDYDKENNILINLVALCIRCHRKTNGNRDYYYAYFTYKIKEKVRVLL